MPTLPGIARLMVPRTRKRTAIDKDVESVTLEVGRDESMIQVTVQPGGKLRLAFGTGEEFIGRCHDMPARVGAAADRLLAVAGSSLDDLRRVEAPIDASGDTIRFFVQTPDAVFVEGAGVLEVKQGRSPLRSLWRGFSDLLQPMMVVLFRRPVSGATQDHTPPGLVRARNLWG